VSQADDLNILCMLNSGWVV